MSKSNNQIKAVYLVIEKEQELKTQIYRPPCSARDISAIKALIVSPVGRDCSGSLQAAVTAVSLPARDYGSLYELCREGSTNSLTSVTIVHRTDLTTYDIGKHLKRPIIGRSKNSKGTCLNVSLVVDRDGVSEVLS